MEVSFEKTRQEDETQAQTQTSGKIFITWIVEPNPKPNLLRRTTYSAQKLIIILLCFCSKLTYNLIWYKIGIVIKQHIYFHN